jgi:acetyl esterase/lipase
MPIKKMLLGLITAISTPALAQLPPPSDWAASVESKYQVDIDVPYTSQAGAALSMDIYSRRDVNEAQPTVVFFHGGFWVRGNKNTQLLNLVPWLEMGWNVVNVGYRLGATAPAPAALIDAFCAMSFVAANARTYRIDPSKIVTSGQSAGGHLALAMAMIPPTEGFNTSCPEGPTINVAAVVNWYGVTDVPDVIQGPNRSEVAASWFDGVAKPIELAQRLSPIRYVRDDLPPILTIQGDADAIVPYAQGVALHKALALTNVPNQLLTIPDGGHGRFTAGQRQTIYTNVQDFLMEAGLSAAP